MYSHDRGVKNTVFPTLKRNFIMRRARPKTRIVSIRQTLIYSYTENTRKISDTDEKGRRYRYAF